MALNYSAPANMRTESDVKCRFISVQQLALHHEIYIQNWHISHVTCQAAGLFQFCRPQKGLKCGWFECCFIEQRWLLPQLQLTFCRIFSNMLLGYCLTSFRILALSSLYKVCLSSSRYLKRSQCIFVFESAYSLHEKGFLVLDNAFWTHKCLVVCSVFTITWGGTSCEACKPPLNAGKVVVGLEGVCLHATCTSFGYTSRTHSAWVPDPECSIACRDQRTLLIYTPVWKST